MKILFADLPVTRMNPDHGDKCFEVIQPFRFMIDRDMIEIPAGFWTDWATVSIAASLISPIDPQICRPALAHDFLYFIGYQNSQAICDEFIETAMEFEGAGWLKKNIVFIGVQIGGTSVWQMYRQSVSYFLKGTSYHMADGNDLNLFTVPNWRQSP